MCSPPTQTSKPQASSQILPVGSSAIAVLFDPSRIRSGSGVAKQNVCQAVVEQARTNSTTRRKSQIEDTREEASRDGGLLAEPASLGIAPSGSIPKSNIGQYLLDENEMQRLASEDADAQASIRGCPPSVPRRQKTLVAVNSNTRKR